MKRKIITYTIGILVCIIIDAAFVAIAIYHEAPVSDYILMGIFSRKKDDSNSLIRVFRTQNSKFKGELSLMAFI